MKHAERALKWPMKKLNFIRKMQTQFILCNWFWIATKNLNVEVYPKWPLTLGIHTLVPSHTESWLACVSIRVQKWSGDVWFLRLAHKNHNSSHLALSLGSPNGKSQLPCHENTQAVLWRRPRGEDWDFLSQLAPTCYSYEWAILEVHPPTSVKPADDCNPGQYLDCNFIRDSEL